MSNTGSEVAPPVPSTIDDLRNRHAGEVLVVCGCGSSLGEVDIPDNVVTIGVNDVGRLLTPDYLVLLNPLSSFKGDRRQHVEASRAPVVISHLRPALSHGSIVRVKLGARGGVDVSPDGKIPFSNNSPYVAACLARFMGARRIGLIGVDFTPNHFFGATGTHHLVRALPMIDRHFRKFREACLQDGIELFNLSPHSRLTSLPIVSMEAFMKDVIPAAEIEAPGAPVTEADTPLVQQTATDVAIEVHRPGIVGDFLDDLAETAERVGYNVTRTRFPAPSRGDGVSIVWNGRRHRSVGRTIYCEHGWLPRTDYQLSYGGINADSHIAPFAWDGNPLDEEQRRRVREHLASIRTRSSNYEFMQPAKPALTNLPEAFLLVPFQMEWDTNIVRHVPPEFRRMQAFVDWVSASDPPYPIIFKQHPADRSRGNRQLRLRLRRPQDSIRRHNDGNVHQILKSDGRCRCVISLNSNVVHDGLIWDVPSIVLGNNVWPRGGENPSPFLHALPEDWDAFEAWNADPNTEHSRNAYAAFLLQNQWTREDVKDDERVLKLLDHAAGLPALQSSRTRRTVSIRPQHRQERLRVNVVARNLGWLFEDIKQAFADRPAKGVDVVASTRPLSRADAWIVIRTKECRSVPDPLRTVVQVHDLFDDGCYRQGGDRASVARCAALSLTHPLQQQLIENSGINLSETQVLLRPIGAPEAFKPRDSMSDQFTVGWSGRPVMRKGEEIKRVQWIVDSVLGLGGEVDVLLMGERLEKYQSQLQGAGISSRYLERRSNPYNTYPTHYAGLDCALIASVMDAGPMSLFQAIASGVPVISTRVGWAEALIRHGETGFLVDSVDEMTEAMRTIRSDRAGWFERRKQIAAALEGQTFESWIDENLAAAVELSRSSLA